MFIHTAIVNRRAYKLKVYSATIVLWILKEKFHLEIKDLSVFKDMDDNCSSSRTVYSLTYT